MKCSPGVDSLKFVLGNQATRVLGSLWRPGFPLICVCVESLKREWICCLFVIYYHIIFIITTMYQHHHRHHYYCDILIYCCCCCCCFVPIPYFTATLLISGSKYWNDQKFSWTVKKWVNGELSIHSFFKQSISKAINRQVVNTWFPLIDSCYLSSNDL